MILFLSPHTICFGLFEYVFISPMDYLTPPLLQSSSSSTFNSFSSTSKLLLLTPLPSDESDTGLLTSGGDVISVFLPDSAVSLYRVSISSSQNASSPSSSSQPQKLANHQKHSLSSSSADRKPFVEASGISSRSSRSAGGPSNSIDHLSHFDDLSLVNYPPDGAASLTKDEMKKEKAKLRRRRQRKVIFMKKMCVMFFNQ